MRVAVIGAGAAGLCCARHLNRYPEYFRFQVFDKMEELGGTWIYSPATSTSGEEQVHSSMYKNLRTNLPKEIMFFPGFPFPSHCRSFVHHSEVLKYLQSYASHYDINKFIKFGTLVNQVKPVITVGDIKNGMSIRDQKDSSEDDICFHNWGRFADNIKWQVTTEDIQSGRRICEDYDAIFVCNGHFSTPTVPALPGLSCFPGQIIHSHLYREPEVYKNQNVLVVGSGQSGRDIILDLSTCARNVYFCNRGHLLVCSLPDNVEQVSGITEVLEDGNVLFNDGRKRLVDSIILATGYMYSFPFLSEDAGVEVKSGKRVTPLFKQTFNPVHPSMGFIGINFGFNPFPYFDYQVRCVLSVWAGDKKLPSLEDMIKDDEEWYQARLETGLPPHKAGHYLGTAQWDMMDLFAKMLGASSPPPVMEGLYNEVAHQRNENLMLYKNYQFIVHDDKNWARVK